MDYQSLSTLIVLAIVVLVLACWLPNRTVNGMKRVIQHREDRYSPSLHLIDAHSATRFSDERTPRAKGAIMQPTQSSATLSRAHIEHVRQLRRSAVRRRQMLVLSLALTTLAVVVAALVWHFSAWFALIPAVLLAVVVTLGMRASRHARAWERRVAQRSRLSARGPKVAERSKAGRQPQVDAVTTHGDERAQPVGPLSEPVATSRDDTPTDVMEQREIRRALRQARAEAQAALDRRQSSASDMSDVCEDQALQAPLEQESTTLTVHDETVERDATIELHEVHAARELDAVDMTSCQDLISFSLGAPRDGVVPQVAEPQSLEIRSSAKQVAQAVPVEAEEARRIAESVQRDDDSDMVEDCGEFHDRETHADIDAPQETSDSLGSGLETILARRNS